MPFPRQSLAQFPAAIRRAWLAGALTTELLFEGKSLQLAGTIKRNPSVARNESRNTVMPEMAHLTS